MKKSIKEKVLTVMGAVVLTAAGFVIIPPLIQKVGNKIYKSSLKRNKIDFDHMGPKIVNKNSDRYEEEEK